MSRISFLAERNKDFLSHHLRRKKIAFLDLPIYLNIGDLLIERGSEDLFAELDCEVVFRGSFLDFSSLERQNFTDDVVIILQGGGNFGDLYPRHNDYRKKVFERFSKNRIIMLPQSVHYNDGLEMEKDAELFSKHDNFLFICRDKYSYEAMSKYFPLENLGLLPDMAYCIDSRVLSSNHRGSGSCGVLNFRRRDEERLVDELAVGFDWEDLLSPMDRYLFRRIKKKIAKSKVRLRVVDPYVLWGWYRDYLIKKAVRLFLMYSSVDADRLHAYILAQLMSINTVVHDNSYGKIRRYRETWFENEIS